MPRQARLLSVTGIYHIIFRGVNRCHLFEEEDDFEKMLSLLIIAKEELGFEVLAYCMLDNHVHLLLKEKSPGEITKVMLKLLAPYAFWYNRKYGRSGALIANRYRSERVENDEYLLTLVRYIHQNPLLAGVCNLIDGCRWCSFPDYVKGRSFLTDTRFVLEMFSTDRTKAIKEFVSFHDTLETEDYSYSREVKRTKEEIRQEFLSLLGGVEPGSLVGLPRLERDAILTSLRKHGFSIRQIERLTGVSRGIIAKCMAKGV
ncbi:MAG: transposase [Coriobacteriia bacterium]|nr:transposase [Coriobacteriia bacterium]MCL2749807.1 transposase [Coriobacteriia bacterium]